MVLNVVLSPAGDDTFDNTITELKAQGYNRPDRKYLIFMDAQVLCGISTLYSDDRSGNLDLYAIRTANVRFQRGKRRLRTGHQGLVGAESRPVRRQHRQRPGQQQ